MEYEMGLRPKMKQECKQVNKHMKSQEKINMQTIRQNIKNQTTKEQWPTTRIARKHEDKKDKDRHDNF